MKNPSFMLVMCATSCGMCPNDDRKRVSKRVSDGMDLIEPHLHSGLGIALKADNGKFVTHVKMSITDVVNAGGISTLTEREL